MKIEILAENAFDRDGRHLSKVAWDISRNSTDAKLLEVLAVDAPVNEMPSVVMCITSTILEREVIAGIKEHSMWASSSRVDNLYDFKMDENVSPEAESFADDARWAMRRKHSEGQGQDRFRLLLPILSTTHYTVRLNLRACAILADYFDELAMLNEGTRRIFEAANIQFRIVVGMLGGSSIKYKPAEILGNQIPLDKPDFAETIGAFTVVHHNSIFSLRTHMIRHRLFTVVDDLKGWIRDGVSDKALNSPMAIGVSATNTAWLNVGTKRACWLAQSDLWTPMLKLAGDSIGDGLMDALPCDDGDCPFKRDVQLRLEGKDPNAPCPKYLQMYGILATDSQHEAIGKEINDGKRSDYWKKSEWLGDAK